MYLLRLSAEANSDLKAIYQFGLNRWGASQREEYLTSIKQQLWALTEPPLIGAKRPEIMPNLQSLGVGSHVVFYRVNDSCIEIIRILHKRQDALHHIL